MFCFRTGYTERTESIFRFSLFVFLFSFFAFHFFPNCTVTNASLISSNGISRKSGRLFLSFGWISMVIESWPVDKSLPSTSSYVFIFMRSVLPTCLRYCLRNFSGLLTPGDDTSSSYIPPKEGSASRTASSILLICVQVCCRVDGPTSINSRAVRKIRIRPLLLFALFEGQFRNSRVYIGLFYGNVISNCIFDKAAQIPFILSFARGTYA